MLINIKAVSRSILITAFSVNLIACGGGSGGSDIPLPPAKDIVPPVIVATKPASEQIDIKTNAFIEVTFNEAIANVDTNQVDIYPYDVNKVLSGTRIKLKQNPFSYDSQRKTLSISPKIDELQLATKYQVTISDIKDTSGNVMVGSCQWDFGTSGFPDFGIGNTGVCGSPPPIAPDNPKNVKAVAGDGKVIISWQAATTGADVTYFKLEKSINNAQNFSVVDGNVAATKFVFIDKNVQIGTTYIYRVSAGNDFDISNAIQSNPITPISVQATVVPDAPQNVEAIPGNTTVTITWSAPITGDKVDFYTVEKSVNNAAYVLVKDKIPMVLLSYVDKMAKNNDSHIYRVSAENMIGVGVGGLSNIVRPLAAVPAGARVELISESPGVSNYFGEAMAFSSDGNTIVIGERQGDTTGLSNAGTVQIFTKKIGTWTLTQTLNSQVPGLNVNYGYSLAISQDGSTLAIGSATSNFVELYIKSATGWFFSQKLVPNGASSSSFGRSVAFHPNSTLLAVGDMVGSLNGTFGAGIVQLFKKITAKWSYSETITSKLPADSNFFGVSVNFSPDGSTLAVGEQLGDIPLIKTDAGTVQLFTQKNGTNWSYDQTLVSNKPGQMVYFGGGRNSVSFSPDSNTVVISEFGLNNVQLFTRTAGKWNFDQVLKVTNAIGKFGVAVAFSADAKTIAIGERDGISNGIDSTGNVYLFNKSGTNWVLSRTITAAVPTKGNFFGSSLFFNSINNELAIFEEFGDTAAAKDAGVVSIIDLSQLP